MNRALILRSLLLRAKSNFSTSTRTLVKNKVKENQVRFQNNDGQEEALKAGSSVDPRLRTAYNAGMSILVITVACLGYAIYASAHKSKQHDSQTKS